MKEENAPRIRITRSEYQGQGTLYVRVEITEKILHEWLRNLERRKAYVFALREEEIGPEPSG